MRCFIPFKSIINVLCVLCIGGSFSSLRGATITISPTSDLTPAFAALKAGDTLLLRGGRYGAAKNPSIQGTASARILIKSYPGETAIIRSVAMNNCRYVDFSNIVFDATGNGYGEAIWFGNGTSYCRVMDSEVKNSEGQGILVPHVGCDYNEFLRLSVHHNGAHSLNNTPQDHGLYIAGRYNIVDECDVFSNYGYGAQIYNGYPGERADGNIIRNSKAHHNGTGGNAAGIAASSGSNNQILNNQVYSNPRGIDVAWKNPVSTIVKGNQVDTIFINSDSSNAVVENNCIDPTKITDKSTSTTKKNNGPGMCSGSTPPPPPTGVDVTQQPPPTSQPSGPSVSDISAPFLIAGVIVAALLFSD